MSGCILIGGPAAGHRYDLSGNAPSQFVIGELMAPRDRFVPYGDVDPGEPMVRMHVYYRTDLDLTHFESVVYLYGDLLNTAQLRASGGVFVERSTALNLLLADYTRLARGANHES